MSIQGFSKVNHLSELDEPLDTQEGVLSPATRRARTLENLLNSETAADQLLALTSSLLLPVVPAAVQQAINANGAISITAYYTAITSVNTSGQTFTLADGSILGQMKKMQLIVDGGDATVTFNGTATIVFADAGDVAVLIWNGSDWVPIELSNDADGATAPVYTPAA